MDFMADMSLVLDLPLFGVGGASFISRDVYGHRFTATGTPWTSHGRDFDGVDDCLQCNDSPALDITESLTLEAWIKITLNGSGGLIHKDDSTADRGYHLYYQANSW